MRKIVFIHLTRGKMGLKRHIRVQRALNIGMDIGSVNEYKTLSNIFRYS